MLNTSNDKILTEIGELFGRYKDERGNYVNFQDVLERRLKYVSKSANNGEGLKSTSYEDLIQWSTEAYNRKHPNNNAATEQFFSGVLNTVFNDAPGSGRRFYDWQRKVISHLQNTNNDIYVVAPPGGGKTTPLMAHYMVDLYMGGKNGDMNSLQPNKVFSNTIDQETIKRWSNIFHSLLTGKQLNGTPTPRCLFVTPIRVLSFEQAEGFQEYFIDLMLFLRTLVEKSTDQTPQNSNESYYQYMDRLKKNSNSNIDQIIGNVFGSVGEPEFNKFRTKIDDIGPSLKSRTQKMICVKTGGGSEPFNDMPEHAIVTIATYGSAKNFISKISNLVKFIVFDEAHLYMPSEYGPNSNRSQESEVNAASDAYTIIDGMAKQKNAQIAFLSGTIHPVSAQNFCDYVNKQYGRHLAVVSTEKGDTQSGNKTDLRVIEDDSIRDEREQVNRIVRWVQRDEKGNAIILFSKRKINKLVDEAVARLGAKNVRTSNPKDRKISSEIQGKIERYRNAIKMANPNASPSEIQAAVDREIQRLVPTTQKEMIDRIKAKPGAEQIENPKLRNAVSHGIGFIYRQDDVEANDRKSDNPEDNYRVSEQDKLIVANLFSSGKINVLLATAAIGVGVNVSIRNMYLPSCMKFEKNKYNVGQIDLNNKREMSQLINRTGRGVSKISGIYTPKEFVPFLQDVVSAGIDDFNKVPAISFRSSDNLKDILLALSSVASKVKNYPINTSKSVSSFIGKKLGDFTKLMRSFYVGKSRDQLSDDPNMTWKQEKAEEELKQYRANMDRVWRYRNTENKIDEYEKKLSQTENAIKDCSNKIAEIEQKLSRSAYNSVRNILKSDLMQWKETLEQQIFKQDLLRVSMYNAISKELNDIHDSSFDSNRYGKRTSKYNRDYLLNRLNTIQKIYDVSKLNNRNSQVKILTDQLNEYNRDLNQVKVRYNAMMQDPNVLKSDLKKMKDYIDNRERFIREMADNINRLDFHLYTPTQTNGSNIRY